MPVDKVVYHTSATAHGGRDGESRLDNGDMAVKLAEQLFAMGYAACFLGAMKHVASKHDDLPKVPSGAAVNATVGIGPMGDVFGLDIELKVTLPGVDHAAGQKLVDAAHKVCPYSNATRNNVPVRLVVA